MSEKHLDPRLFDRLLRGRASAEEVRELAWHLVEACPECARVADHEWAISSDVDAEASVEMEPALPETQGSEGPISFDRIRRRIAASVARIHRQKGEAPALLAELGRHPLERQRLLLRNNPRFHTAPFAELLLDKVWEESFDQPAAAEAQVEVVLELLDQIGSELPSEEVLNDLRGRAWAFRGNFRRVLTDFRAADEAFSRAEELLASGTGDLHEKARLLTFRSTLRRARFELEVADELIQAAIGIYRSTGESHLTGRAMISRALILSEQSEPQAAIGVLKEALGLIDVDREPRLLLVAQQNLMQYLMELGRYEEAATLLPSLRRRTIEKGSRLELLNLRWNEGKMLLGLGHEARAEAALLEVRKGFIEQGIGYETASVSLELAALYLRQGRTPEIKQLAAEMLPIFESRDVHREVLAALVLFKKAVEMETVSVRLVEEVAALIRRSQERPPPARERPS